MGFTNAKSILSGKVGFDAVKLLLMVAKTSRPRLSGLSSMLLRPFIHDGEVSIRYRCRDRWYKVFIRMQDEKSDALSVMELAIRDVYHVDPKFAADRVVDGGGNIGLFTLAAAAAYPQARITACEPVPANIAQLQKHLRINGVQAEIQPVCIGGSRSTIPFYCREANQGSFDPTKPYSSRIDVKVLPLREIVGEDAQRICIKLDIEGMEVEVLETYVPGETRAVSIVGELHHHKENKPHLERIFSTHGWRLRFEDEYDAGSIFFAHSPAAMKLMAS